VTGDDARHSIEVIEAIRRSHALAGQRVELEPTASA
jgi:hypothetical protein